MKGQSAFEYMLILLIVLGFLIPLWLYVNNMHTETSSEFSMSYARSAVDRLASTADLIYSQGPTARVKVSIYIPDGVEGFNITNHTVDLVVRNRDGTVDVFATSRARLNGTIPISRGNYLMIVEAVEDVNYDVNFRKA
jgi:uncharacterized protein (UPF0333 family)